MGGTGNAISIHNNNDKVANFNLHAKNGKIILGGQDGALVSHNINFDVKSKEVQLFLTLDHFYEEASAISVRSKKGITNIDTNTLYVESLGNNKSIYAQYNGVADVNVRDSATIVGHIEAKENGRVVINADTLNLEGDVFAGTNGSVHISSKQNSTVVGSTHFGHQTDYGYAPSNNGENNLIELSFGKNSYWNLTDNSELTSLKVDQTTIDFIKPVISSNKFKEIQDSFILKTESIEAKDSTLRMHVNMDKISDDPKVKTADRLVVSGAAKGNLLADIDILGKGSSLAGTTYIPYWMISQGEGSALTIHNSQGKNTFSGSGMVSVWALSFVKEDEESLLNTQQGLHQLAQNNTGNGKGKWYLIRADRDESIIFPQPEVDPGHGNDQGTTKPEDPLEMQQILDLGISSMQAMSFAAELDDLRARIGEVRHGVSDGAWARASYRKERIFGKHSRAFKQETEDLHIGLDHVTRSNDDSAWLIGGALRYAKSDQKGVGLLTNDGKLQQYSAKLYATYLHDSGSYADFVIQTAFYDQELNGVTNNGHDKFNADYHTWGYGLSAEFGRQFLLGNAQIANSKPFFEPQLQLSYFAANGKEYRTSTGMKITQEDADFLTGRLGFVLGNTYRYGDNSNDRAFQIAISGGMKYEFLGDQTVKFTGVEGISKTRKADEIDGARFYYGITSDWKMNNSVRAYVKLEREEGHHYTKDLDVSVGLRYQF